jgi:hypothetical protein
MWAAVCRCIPITVIRFGESGSLADRVKTHGRNDSVEYFSATARIPMPRSMNVRCLLEFRLDILEAGEVYALRAFWNRVFTQSA